MLEAVLCLGGEVSPQVLQGFAGQHSAPVQPIKVMSMDDAASRTRYVIF